MSTQPNEREALTDLERLYPMWLEKALAEARADLRCASQSLAALKNRQGAYFDGISAMCAARQRILDAWMEIAALSTPPAAVPTDHVVDANKMPTPCAGMSCGTTTAQHSRECIAEHAAAVAGGRFVKAPDDVSEHFAMSKFASRADRDAAMLREIASLREANSTLAGASIVPDHMALVPREPTDGMEAAAENAYEDCGNPFPNWKTAYRAMVAAALQGDGNAK